VGQKESEERTITIKIAQEFHVVGLTEWEAGFYLAEFILAHPGTRRVPFLQHLMSNACVCVRACQIGSRARCASSWALGSVSQVAAFSSSSWITSR
jgi:hypothetical protein